MKRKPRICFVTSTFAPIKPGGAEVQLYLVGKELSKKGWDVHFTSIDLGQKDIENHEGIKVHKTYKPSGIPILRFFRKHLKFLNVLKKIDADIYHQRGAGIITAIVGYYCSKYKKKFVFTTAHIDDCKPDKLPLLTRIFYLYGIKKADKIITLAEYMKDELKKNLGLNSIIIKSGHPTPKKNLQKHSYPVVLWVGRLVKWKHPELFVKLVKAVPKAKFIMIGSGSQEDVQSIEKTAADLPNLEYIRYVPFANINKYFEEATVFINTSDSEGFPNTFIQAWLAGTPTVSLNVDPDCVICKNRLGFHSKNMQNLIKHTRLILNNDKLRKCLIKNCLDYAKKHHNIKKTAKEHEKLFKELLSLLAEV